MRTLKQLIVSAGRNVCPSGKAEWILFASFFILYGAMGLSLALNTGLLDTQTGHAGSYLGYDNLYYLKTRGGALDISHPFLGPVLFLKYIISLPFTELFGNKGAIGFSVLLTALMVSLSLTVLFRYLLKIVQLPLLRSLLLTVFCGSFFTVIVLSFTIDTYPFSFLVLILCTFTLSHEYKEQQRFSPSTVLFWEFLCGGITITNAVKPLSAMLLNQGSLKSRIQKTARLLLPFLICVAVVFALYASKSGLSDTKTANSPVSVVVNNLSFEGDFIKEVFSDYWSSSIISAPLTLQTIRSETVLRPAAYPHWWQYMLPASLLLLFGASFLTNRKNTLVQLLFFYLLTDIVIHFVFRYGLNEAIIFGGHWLFLVPVLLGWLYIRFGKSKQAKYALDIYLLFFTAILLFNNIGEILRSFFAVSI